MNKMNNKKKNLKNKLNHILNKKKIIINNLLKIIKIYKNKKYNRIHFILFMKVDRLSVLYQVRKIKFRILLKKQMKKSFK